MKMESRYEEEKMAFVYKIMEKNKLRKGTEDLQTQLKKFTSKEVDSSSFVFDPFVVTGSLLFLQPVLVAILVILRSKMVKLIMTIENVMVDFPRNPFLFVKY